MTQKVEGIFYPLQHDEWIRACQELTPAQRDVLYFIRTLDPYGNGLEINCAEIARELSGDRKQVHRQTVFRAIKKLEVKGFIEPDLYLKADGRSNLEDQIQASLQNQLGGLREVATPAGRIDLLTDSEIIEVKRLEDSQAALGQILVYSGFYPEHSKRIHLFGSQRQLQEVADKIAACLPFDVKVTAQEVGA